MWRISVWPKDVDRKTTSMPLKAIRKATDKIKQPLMLKELLKGQRLAIANGDKWHFCAVRHYDLTLIGQFNMAALPLWPIERTPTYLTTNPYHQAFGPQLNLDQAVIIMSLTKQCHDWNLPFRR